MLFLGAGASIGSKNSKGEDPPTGKHLARLLADKFLGGSHRDDPLQIVAELAISESDLFTVQEFIRDIYNDFQPASFHTILPTFKWTAIATTNFDLIIERAYQSCKKPAQDLVPIIKNGDRFEQKMRSANCIALLKLHGCITCTSDADLPLILSVDQYITHRRGRDRLFYYLQNWAYECPIIFVGHSLQDPDIRHMIMELGSMETRPRFYTVTPMLSGVEQRLWESKRISSLQGTFEDFLDTIDSNIPSPFRGIVIGPSQSELDIAERFVVLEPHVSEGCRNFINNDVEYVRRGIPTETLEPQLFYHGFSGGWSAIEQNLDVRRDLSDSILSNIILDPSASTESGFRFYVIKGHAGSGKSVLLRRIAYEAAISFDKLCIFMRRHGQLSSEALIELSQLTGEHVFLFVDKICDKVPEMLEFIKRALSARLPVTMISAERVNEWNMSCEELNPYVTNEFEVEYLSSKEIEELLKLLEQHHSLGRLEQATKEERQIAFKKRAGRQLLVALHEATLGKPFEDIIADEYGQIKPSTAQNMYLGICVLNRFDIPVRAGVIARVFGIRFTDFQERFFKPLEKVVFASYDYRSRDYIYVARHPIIAEIVFERILPSAADRLDWYIRFLNALNIDYNVDRIAYRRLIRGRSLLEIFPEHKMIETLYEVSTRIAGDDPYLFHQRALYEMNRENGNMTNATDYLQRAQKLAPHDRTILHSMSELELKKAELSKTQLEVDAHLKQATKLAKSLTGPRAIEAHGYHTLAKIGLLRIRALVERPTEELSDLEFSQEVKNTEEVIQEGLQKFPDDPYILEAESNLSQFLTDEVRAITALTKAFDSNPHNVFVAIRLARQLAKNEQIEQAENIYKRALDASPNEKKLHYNYARLLIDTANPDQNLVEYHTRRAFTEGDRNYDAQFWYARQLYIMGSIPESIERFRKLREYPINPALKRATRGVMVLNGQMQVFSGKITKVEPTYSFITRDGTGDTIFIDKANTGEEVWNQLKLNLRVKFNIGFNFYGPNALNTKLE